MPQSLDGPWYVWILEDSGGDLYTVANAFRPGQVGTKRERIDEPKHAWVVRRGNLHFGAGWYEGIGE